MNIPKMSIPRVVIVGGGFAGVSLSKGLRGKDFQVVLIDRHNYHTFQPLLYQVATGGLEPGSIAFPLRKTLNDVDNYYYRMTEVLSVDDAHKKNCYHYWRIRIRYIGVGNRFKNKLLWK